MRISMRRFATDEKGATIVEFAIAAIFVFGLIGVGLDMGLALYEYNLLTHAATKTARDYGASLGERTGESCEDLGDEVEGAAETYLRNGLGKGGSYSFESEVLSKTSTSPPLLRLKGNWVVNCYICILSPKDIVMTTTSETYLEDSEFYCT